jgi:hypothetical protein
MHLYSRITAAGKSVIDSTPTVFNVTVLPTGFVRPSFLSNHSEYTVAGSTIPRAVGLLASVIVMAPNQRFT